ncbi:MAG: exopolysaccharide biosynthesis polyprenyl glycosylphosphotransferase, partial [Candidatus Brocadiae bacterium]|nr:exopolysaccharide biosynthesis polyprenyl glycosylphosphotransferase [Candidatus Brocadiia bacterium]
ALPLPAAARVLPGRLRDAVCVLVLATVDIASAFGAVGAAWGIREALPGWLPFQQMTLISWLDLSESLAIAIVAGFLVRGLYLRREPAWEMLRLTFSTLLLSLGFALAALYLTNIAGGIPRSLAFLCGGIVLLAAPAARFAALGLLHRLGFWSRTVIVVGSPDAARDVADDLEADFCLGYRVASVLTTEQAVNGLLPEGFEEAVVASHGLDAAVAARLVSDLHRRVRAVTLVPDFGSMPFGRSSTRFLFDRQRILLTTANLLRDPANLLVKRLFDLAAAGVLAALALPFGALVTLAIRLTSPGPAIFAQPRIGRHGVTFRCLKFRTMYRDAEDRLEALLSADPDVRAEWERFHKLRDDPRVTPLGRLLRATSLDELPQLLNVLAGSMSLVGPRPLPDYHYEKFEEPFRSDYLEVKPGITGLWQVSGRSEADVARMAALNSWYARNWSLWLDLTLLARTIPVVLGRRGAW